MNCLLPEHGVFISPEGYLTACCVSMDDRFGNVKDQHPIDIFNGPIAKKFREDFKSGNLPTSCDKCINKEHYNLRTSKTRIIKQQLKVDSTIIYADITLGNICKLSCVMCNETFSHTWAKIKNNTNKIWHVSLDKMNEILSILKGVTHVEIKGGDPFNMPHFKKFLDGLYEINPGINILFLTSGVYIEDNHIESLKKFKNFNIGISLEADGKLYQYIRGGNYSLDDVFFNLEKCRVNNILMNGFYFSSVLSFYNIDTWVYDHVTISERFYKKFNFYPNMSLNIVLDPAHQSAYLTKHSVREKFYNDLLSSNLEINKESYSHILENRIVQNVDFTMIKNQIEYYDNLRGFKLLDLKPNLLENLDSRYLS